MFAWYLEEDGTLYSVAKRLTEDEKIPTPTGKPRWNVATVRGILQNPAYTGIAYANRTRSAPARQRKSALLPVGPGESWVWRPREEWIPIPVPAIVTQEVFDLVQEKLAHNQQSAARNNKSHNYLLRALVSCGACKLSAIAQQRIELSALADSIEAFCAQVWDGLANATFAQRRAPVELLIDRVIVTDGEVEIRWAVGGIQPPAQPTLRRLIAGNVHLKAHPGLHARGAAAIAPHMTVALLPCPR